MQCGAHLLRILPIPYGLSIREYTLPAFVTITIGTLAFKCVHSLIYKWLFYIRNLKGGIHYDGSFY